MMDIKPASLDDSRHSATTEERTVLALEMIADQLALIRAELGPNPNPVREDRRDELVSADSERTRQLPPFSDEEHAVLSSRDPDVICWTERRFAVGTYRYTDLQHAIAEAKRARRSAEK